MTAVTTILLHPSWRAPFSLSFSTPSPLLSTPLSLTHDFFLPLLQSLTSGRTTFTPTVSFTCLSLPSLLLGSKRFSSGSWFPGPPFVGFAPTTARLTPRFPSSPDRDTLDTLPSQKYKAQSWLSTSERPAGLLPPSRYVQLNETSRASAAFLRFPSFISPAPPAPCSR